MEETHPLRRWRKRHKKSLAELSGEIGVTPSHISQIETGDRTASMNLATKLADHTGLPLRAFSSREVAA